MELSSLLPERLSASLPSLERWLPLEWLSGLEPQALEARASEWLAKPLALGVAGARSGLFFAESVPLLALQRLVGGSPDASSPPPPEARQAVLAALRELTLRDAENIERGLYPLSVLAPVSSPVAHATRYLRLLADSVAVAARKRERKPREFAADAARFADEMPAYYRRNYHFQTDGYLSEESADLYEHQVEILFRGVADAMRRTVIPPLAEHFESRRRRGRKARNTRGRGLRLLELGAGCGTATRFVAQAFPEARITCLDLSPPYLHASRKRLAAFDRIEFLQGDAADLDLRDERFDAVYSVFLFHELPLRERKRVLAEARRVLQPGGVQVLVDSLQRGDVPELDWALDEFPKQFHEPFFRNYARNPIETLVDEAGFEATQTSTGFLAKTVSATR